MIVPMANIARQSRELFHCKTRTHFVQRLSKAEKVRLARMPAFRCCIVPGYVTRERWIMARQQVDVRQLWHTVHKNNIRWANVAVCKPCFMQNGKSARYHDRS